MGGPSICFSRSLVICHIVEFWVETFEQQQRVEMAKFFHSHPVMSVQKTLNGFTGLCVPQTSETFWLAKQMYCMSVPSKDESGSGPGAEAGNHRGSSSGPDFSLQAHPGERRWLGLRTSLAGYYPLKVLNFIHLKYLTRTSGWYSHKELSYWELYLI